MSEAGGARLSGWRLWLAGARPKTLPAAVVPVLVGTMLAAGMTSDLNSGGWFHYAPGEMPPSWDSWSMNRIVVWRMLAAMVVALAIQIGTNYANDYSDGKRGTDDPGQRSGPPRLVGWGLAPAKQVKVAAMISFGVAAVAGLTLAIATTWLLIPLGLVCFAAGWFYTGGPRPYGYAGLGEVFVFVFFGLVATMGSLFVQLGRVAPRWRPKPFPPGVPDFSGPPLVLTLGTAVAVGCLATALLVINNLRDIPGDTISGKRTLAVKLGDRRTRILYVVLLVLPFVLVPVACGLGDRPLGAASLFAILLANKPVLLVLQGAQGRALIPVLEKTGRVQLVFGVLLAAGLYLSAP